MKKWIITTGFFLLAIQITKAQEKFYTKGGEIRFYSKAPLETIEAVNKSVTCVMDTKIGLLQFVVLMKGFEFRKALMQEHFNENYLESDKFPKAEFKGQITNNADINYGKNGSYEAKVKGRLFIHGETRDIETTGTITIEERKIKLNSVFNILLADYKISIPSTVADNISKTVRITVNCSLTELKTNN